MASKLLGLMSVFLLITACNLIPPGTPGTSQLETSVFQTLTAMPTLPPPTNVPAVVTPTSVVVLATPTVQILPPTGVPPTDTPPASPQPYATPIIQYPNPVPAYSPLYADQFIYYYFNNINQRNYQVTWSLLTDSFKFANNTAGEGGFLGYANFWDSVLRVDIFGVTITSHTGNFAVVSVNMRYNYRDGNVVSNLQTYNLVYDAGRGTWLFNSFTPIPTSVPPLPGTQTPQQFMNYYFSTINAGNYSLAWTFLTDGFKAVANHGSFTDYATFWGSVARVDIASLNLVSQTGSDAIVDITLVFNYNGGLVTSETVRYHLIYDAGRGTWLFTTL